MSFRRRLLAPIFAVVSAASLMALNAPAAHAYSSTGFSAFMQNCGGTTVYKDDGTPWQCTFDDEFNGSNLNTRNWVVQTNFSTGDATAGYACYVNNPNNVAVSNGALHLTVRRISTPMDCASQPSPTNYTGGMVSTYHLFSQAYGRFEARVRVAATTQPGLQEAFWLWPDDRYTVLNWPTTGEIDVAETYSQYANLAVPYLHYTYNDNGGPIPGVNTAWNCAAQRGVWNTYDLVWTPTSLTISINGTTCLVNTSADPAFTERYIVALTAGLGRGTNALTSSTPIPATTDVDYVRVWK